jgi:hypothetical protein
MLFRLWENDQNIFSSRERLRYLFATRRRFIGRRGGLESSTELDIVSD